MAKVHKVNVKEKVEDNVCDLSLSELRGIPVKDIVSMRKVHCEGEKSKQIHKQMDGWAYEKRNFAMKVKVAQ